MQKKNLQMRANSKKQVWYELDNAGNLFPSISDGRNTNVFRLSCELKEPVCPDLLQQALDKALLSHPYFCMIMRRGFFWFYLEETDLRPTVYQENARPCNRIFYKNRKNLLFNCTYFGCRINLEVFHALSDGTGAFSLLRSIVYHYIVISHRNDLPTSLPPLMGGVSPPVHQAEDGFERHYVPGDTKSPFKQKSYTIGGTIFPANSVGIISARVSTKQFLSLAKSRGVTATIYLCAMMLCAIYTEMVPRRASNKDIGITVPVDLRGFFPSQTSRNFFGVIDIRYNFGGRPADFDKVLQSVEKQFSQKLVERDLERQFGYNMSLQKNIFTRAFPLFLKNLVLKAAYLQGERATTVAISNVGRITMPEEMDPFINCFSCLLNSTPLHRLKLCVCSYNDSFIINFTSCIAETSVQRHFLRHLSECGVDVTITTNGGDIIETM